jgi:exoribonuclease R
MSNISSSWNTLFNKSFNDIHKNNHSNNQINYKNNYYLKLDDLYGLENKRIDYKYLAIYSIDPPKCTDADDAFSIYKENDLIHLLIHIADPTAYFNPNDKLFEDIINNGCTVYLSNREPDHLFPNNILENSSLTDGIKNVVIVHTIFKQNNINYIWSKTTIEYGIINCSNGKRFTYDEAAEVMYNDSTLSLGVDIANFFYSQRQNNNCEFGGETFIIPKIVDNIVVLKPDSKEVRIMKAMICEFAIHANKIFASGLDDDNLFLRTLVLDKSLDIPNNNNLIHHLIKEGISANYLSEKLKHDLIGSYYTHSTSPLRRA